MSCGTCGIQASDTMQGDTGVPAGAPSVRPPGTSVAAPSGSAASCPEGYQPFLTIATAEGSLAVLRMTATPNWYALPRSDQEEGLVHLRIWELARAVGFRLSPGGQDPAEHAQVLQAAAQPRGSGPGAMSLVGLREWATQNETLATAHHLNSQHPDTWTEGVWYPATMPGGQPVEVRRSHGRGRNQGSFLHIRRKVRVRVVEAGQPESRATGYEYERYQGWRVNLRTGEIQSTA